VLSGSAVFDVAADELAVAASLLAELSPRTEPADADVVVRWLGRQPLLVHLTDDEVAAELIAEVVRATWI
jgi:hypothetical protein